MLAKTKVDSLCYPSILKELRNKSSSLTRIFAGGPKRGQNYFSYEKINFTPLMLVDQRRQKNKSDPINAVIFAIILKSSFDDFRSSPEGAIITDIFTPTPDKAIRWGGRILGAHGYTLSGRLTGAFGTAIEPGGYGKMTGMIMGGATFSIAAGRAGLAIGGPTGAVTLGIVGGIYGGGYIGGKYGAILDQPSAGYLNYGEFDEIQ